jgi:hypothetical protein
MKRDSRITEKQVSEALQRFVQRGGLIKRLPPEIVPAAMGVGAQHGRFEPLSYYARAGTLQV